jgi:hypothetical protein
VAAWALPRWISLVGSYLYFALPASPAHSGSVITPGVVVPITVPSRAATL